MKRNRKLRRFAGVTVILALCVFALGRCIAVQVGGAFTLNTDGSGHRVVTAYLYDSDTGDGYGNAYRFSKLHGAALRDYVAAAYRDKVPGSDEWLTVTVSDTITAGGVPAEVVSLSFDFTDFEDYAAKVSALARFGAAGLPGDFVPPRLVKVEDVDGLIPDLYRIVETPATETGIVRPLFVSMIDDPAVIDMTAGGANTAATVDDLKSSGIEAKAVPLTVKLGKNPEKTLLADNGIDETFSMSGQRVNFRRNPTELVLYYAFDNSLADGGSAGAGLTLGAGSASGETYAEGISGQGFKFDGKTYLKSGRAFGFEELTVSFYYKADAWTDTDTGAEMVLVNAALDALGVGALDIEFYKDAAAEYTPVIFMAKTNGTNWQNQDKMETETFFNNRLGEWHHVAVVYENDYDDTGDYDYSYIYLYIDGVLRGRMEQYNAAGLTKRLGIDEGFNVGGYFEADIVKRALTGTLDELRVYNGPLSGADIAALYAAHPVAAVYDPEAAANKNPAPVAAANSGSAPGSATVLLVVVVCLLIAGAAVVTLILRRKKIR